MLPSVQQQYFALKGGLDTETPALSVDPGRCFDAQNYECSINGGYRRIDGYERFDGRTEPHSVSYWTLPVTITGTIAVGDTVTGASSGATGKALQVNADELVLGRVTGTWQDGESVQVAAVTQATATDVATENGALTAALSADYTLLAANDYRADITAVPGSGPIRGMHLYKDVLYAFRNNAGGSAGAMYKSTTGGWSLVSLGMEVAFTAGGGATPAEGATLTQGGVTATIRRIVRRTGAWSGSAAGVFVITGLAGGNFAAGAATATGGVTCTLSGVQTAITLPAGGRYELVNYNFTGSTDTLRMYGVNGVGTAFEFDGTYFVPIRTGMATDTPSHIAAHKNHLFLTFRGSLQFSGIMDPYAWTPVLGANEIGFGDTITGLSPQTGDASGGAMAVYGKNKTMVLYGSSSSDFKLTMTDSDTGAVEWTEQQIGGGFALSERGIVQLATTQNYGDFNFASVTRLQQRFVDARKGTAQCSVISKERNEYRLWYSDGSGLVVTIAGSQIVGVLPLFYTDAPYCACQGEMSDGTERVFFGDADGYVYRDMVGTSFDGETIPARIRLAFNNIGSPRIRKSFKRAVFELDVEEYAEVQASYELSYGSSALSPSAASALAMSGGGGYWDQFTWDDFYWDAQTVLDPSMFMTGTGRNVSLLFSSDRAQDKPHTLQGVIFNFIPRRIER